MIEEKTKEQQMQPFQLKAMSNALLIGAYRSGTDIKVCDDCLDELERLCDTYGLKTVGKIACPIKKLDSAAYRPMTPSEVRVLKQYASSDPGSRPSWRKSEVVNPNRRRIKGVGKPRNKPTSRMPAANRGNSRGKKPRR